MGWQQLADILRQARDEAAEEAARPPTACPRCGEPLREGPKGELFCTFDGWKVGG